MDWYFISRRGSPAVLRAKSHRMSSRASAAHLDLGIGIRRTGEDDVVAPKIHPAATPTPARSIDNFKSAARNIGADIRNDVRPRHASPVGGAHLRPEAVGGRGSVNLYP